MIDSTFWNINRLFVFLFKNGDDPTRKFFDKYYMPLVDINIFTALIYNTPFFDQPVKNKKCMKNLPKCLETPIIQQETYYITHIIKTIIDSLT